MIRIDVYSEQEKREIVSAFDDLSVLSRYDYEVWLVHPIPDDPSLPIAQTRDWRERVAFRQNGISSTQVAKQVEKNLIRNVLEALCIREGRSLDSVACPGEDARNYELADRLGIGHVFGMRDRDD